MTSGRSRAAERTVTVRVPAKVNLALSVGRVGLDGYHPVATVYHAVSVYDHVTAAPGGPGSGITVTVEGSVAGLADVPLDASNIAVRAAALLAESVGLEPDVELRIRKEIPVAGGMAGGSADAAAALVACDRLWQLGSSRSELDGLAAELGADVPFLLHGGTALGLGRGEQLTPVLARGGFSWVFALSAGGLSAGAVYARCDELRAERGYEAVPEPRVPDAVLSAVRVGDATTLGSAMHNDLEAAALSMRPDLRKLLEAGTDHGALGAIVSGSGPTCAFLARDDSHALDLAVALTSVGAGHTVLRARGPVPGARVVETEIS